MQYGTKMPLPMGQKQADGSLPGEAGVKKCSLSIQDRSVNSVAQNKLLSVIRSGTVQRPLFQRQAIKGDGKLTGTVDYETQPNNGEDSAHMMTARDIQLKDPAKKELAGEHSPEVDVPGWGSLQTLGLTVNYPCYKRMHLLNGQLGGTGSDSKNLAPGSCDLNNAHKTAVEQKLCGYVLGGGVIDLYQVECAYRKKALPGFAADPVKSAAYKSTLQSICFYYELDNGYKNGGMDTTLSEEAKIAKAWNNLP